MSTNPDDGFAARSEFWSLGGLTVGQCVAPTILIWRTKTLIRRNPIDRWVLTVCTRGTLDLRTRNEAVLVQPRNPFVVSLADEMSTVKDEYDRVQFYLSRDAFARIASSLDEARGKPLDTPEGKLLCDYMQLLVKEPAGPPGRGRSSSRGGRGSDGRHLPRPVHRPFGRRQGQMDFTLMQRVRRAVGAHPRSPSLGPDKLCRDAATSRSQLYRLLEGEGGRSLHPAPETVRELRDALRLSNALPIGRIAEVLCLADASTFSRAFGREFGMSRGTPE